MMITSWVQGTGLKRIRPKELASNSTPQQHSFHGKIKKKRNRDTNIYMGILPRRHHLPKR
jgi:hypothetical protein